MVVIVTKEIESNFDSNVPVGQLEDQTYQGGVMKIPKKTQFRLPNRSFKKNVIVICLAIGLIFIVRIFLGLIGIVGVLAQFIDGSLGMAFGVTSTSFILSLGISGSLASASTHTAEIFTTLVSGASHLRFGNVDKKIFKPLVGAGVVGGVLGAITLVSLTDFSPRVVQVVVSSVLLALGAAIVLKTSRKRRGAKNLEQETADNECPEGTSRPRLVVLGFIGAYMDSIGGGGWGPICTTTLIVNNTASPCKAVGSVNLAEFFVTVSSTVTFMALLGLENFRWDIVIPLTIGAVLIAPIAAWFTGKIPRRVLGTGVGCLIIFMSIRTILRAAGLWYWF